MKSRRWSPVCLDCWQAAYPSEYAPSTTSFDECTVCGYDSLIVNAAPATVAAITRAVVLNQQAADAALYRVETRSGSGY
jgi:hypothetical protein